MFPTVDVSDSNADMLELLLLHGPTVEMSHTSAEAVSFLYQMGHRVLHLTAAAYFDDEGHSRALSHGIATFEAIAALVRPQPDLTPHNSQQANPPILAARRRLQTDFITTLTDARDVFYEELPRTTMLVGKSAARFCSRQHVDYALTGAALARQLEIDATAA